MVWLIHFIQLNFFARFEGCDSFPHGVQGLPVSHYWIYYCLNCETYGFTGSFWHALILRAAQRKHAPIFLTVAVFLLLEALKGPLLRLRLVGLASTWLKMGMRNSCCGCTFPEPPFLFPCCVWVDGAIHHRVVGGLKTAGWQDMSATGRTSVEF